MQGLHQNLLTKNNKDKNVILQVIAYVKLATKW